MTIGAPSGRCDVRLKQVKKKMERDSFIFYKSFYEAIIGLDKAIRLEILTAIIEYALYGRQPEDLKPFAKGMFTLIKPNIDVNTVRYENGKKGGRKSRASSAKTPSSARQQPASASPAYTLTYGQEIEQMRADDNWRKTICDDFNITSEEYDRRLSRFLEHCNDKDKQRHDSLVDCQSHLRYWMTKAYPRQQTATQPMPDNTSIPFPDVGDDFGGMDYDET